MEASSAQFTFRHVEKAPDASRSNLVAVPYALRYPSDAPAFRNHRTWSTFSATTDLVDSFETKRPRSLVRAQLPVQLDSTTHEDADMLNAASAMLALSQCAQAIKHTAARERSRSLSPQSDSSDSTEVDSAQSDVEYTSNDVDSSHSSTNPIRARKHHVHQCEWPDCGRVFADSSNLIAHRRVHTGERPFACDYDGCQQAFASSSNLIVHKRLHTGYRPYSCSHDGCTLTFADSGALNKHRRAHTGERPYKCEWAGCTKAFGRSGDLIVHRRVHTGERPYHCEWPNCGKSFAQRSTLATHRHSHTGLKPYACEQCPSAFVSRGLLTGHIRVAHPSL